MNTPDAGEFDLQQETLRLHARIAELEEEIKQMRGSMEEPERASAEALRESELQYKEVFENISVCMFLVDVTSDGHFKFAGFNPAEEQAVGLTTAEVSGKLVEEVFADGLAKKVSANYRRCLESGTPITYDDELDLPGGRRYFHSNLIPLRNASGRIHRIVGACIDTTEFKRTQEEALARQKLESLGVLASGIAHDFNNLLGGILASTELALTERAEGSAVKEELQRIKTASIRGGEIVRELMIYGGDENPALEQLDISVLVHEMLQLLKVSISKHAILEIEMGQDLPLVHASPAQIRQVVLNLVTNASEAIGDRPGAIRVSTAKANVGPDSPVPGGVDLAEGDYLRLEVFDTGGGMTPEVQARIFDPFFSTKRAGRGLGLAAVQGIIRSHGGMINVVSTPGQWSRFEVLLPCIAQARLETRNTTAILSTPEPGNVAGTVLVVEDEEILRLAVSKMLRKAEFHVIEAGDGTAGANLFRANERRIDVVLLDLTLPGMSGREVLEELRRSRPDVKVILTSAFGEGRALSLIGEQIPWSYLRKPYQTSELTSLLRRALDNSARGAGAG